MPDDDRTSELLAFLSGYFVGVLSRPDCPIGVTVTEVRRGRFVVEGKRTGARVVVSLEPQ